MCRNPNVPPRLAERLIATYDFALRSTTSPTLVVQSAREAGVCSAGYERSRTEITYMSREPGNQRCVVNWIEPENIQACGITVTLSATIASQNALTSATCQVSVYELGLLPQRPTPCMCW
jgi:hypothetical protein